MTAYISYHVYTIVAFTTICILRVTVAKSCYSFILFYFMSLKQIYTMSKSVPLLIWKLT